MRHFIDEMIRSEPIKYADGSRSEALHHLFHEQGHNSEMKYIDVTPLPEQWYKWEEYMPVTEAYPDETFNFSIDMKHTVVNPPPLQPPFTKELCNYKTYIISHEKAYMFLSSQGREYTFCDRFNPEQLWTLEQTGTCLEDLSLTFTVQGRLGLLKSLMLMHRPIHYHAEI
jgi:hypothetical protein